ncbi:MAG: hypothetical protein V1809_12510 [Planctomycetota bacterium]
MTPNPILKVLSTLKRHNTPALLMGGQACILYGGAEFSRDIDLAIPASPEGLQSLKNVLAELAAQPVFVPPLESAYLEKGHACHFRCNHPEAAGLRIDVLSRIRGCPEFPTLWRRRAEFDIPEIGPVAALSLSDLVQSKKTQRDKDWPMIRRLLEADYLLRRDTASPSDIRGWLAELRTPAYLAALARGNEAIRRNIPGRTWLAEPDIDEDAIALHLDEEEKAVRQIDREYWTPLRRELEMLRHARSPS